MRADHSAHAGAPMSFADGAISAMPSVLRLSPVGRMTRRRHLPVAAPTAFLSSPSVAFRARWRRITDIMRAPSPFRFD